MPCREHGLIYLFLTNLFAKTAAIFKGKLHLIGHFVIIVILLTKTEALPLEMQTVALMRNFCMKCILKHKKSDLGMPNNAIRKLYTEDTLFTSLNL